VKDSKGLIWVACLAVLLTFSAADVLAQKLAYINSQKILASYKESQDAQERLDKINKEWETEAREMQKQFQEQGEQLESQRLLLSEERQKEKQQELQNLYMKIQQFQNEKWGQNGEFLKKQDEVMQPVLDKINTAIRKVGEDERFDYIFDTVAGNILYASPNQTDLTDLVLEELEKGLEKSSSSER
jgi:Skp family chaperone for outer membrane proteins